MLAAGDALSSLRVEELVSVSLGRWAVGQPLPRGSWHAWRRPLKVIWCGNGYLLE